MDIVELMGKQALGRDRPEDYISWAEQRLLAGLESENLPILASMDFVKPVDAIEVRECFREVVKELGIDWPTPEDCIKQYSKIVCRQLIDGSMNVRTGVEVMAGLYGASDYDDPLFLSWLYLDEDISLLDTEHGAIFNYELSKDNADEYVKKFAEQHLKLSELSLPDGFDRYCSCRQCELVSRPKLVRVSLGWLPESVYRVIFRKEPTYVQRCPGCGSQYILSMTSFEGLQAYLDQLDSDHSRFDE